MEGGGGGDVTYGEIEREDEGINSFLMDLGGGEIGRGRGGGVVV